MKIHGRGRKEETFMQDRSMRVFCVGNGCAAPCDSTAFDRKEAEKVLRIHRMTPGYTKTPMVVLGDLARRGGVKAVLVKDESKRFGLKAFKGLGGICAMFRILCRELGLDPAETTLDTLRSGPRAEQIKKMVFITTTDGNHGKGVSWAAGTLAAAPWSICRGDRRRRGRRPFVRRAMRRWRSPACGMMTVWS